VQSVECSNIGKGPHFYGKGLKSGFSLDDVIKSQEFEFEFFLNFKRKCFNKKTSKTNIYIYFF
jgi:hypothetical protein